MATPLVFQSILLFSGDIPITIANGKSGPADSLYFTVHPGGSNEKRNLAITGIGTFSAATINLQYSTNGGATWSAYSTADTAFDLHAVNPAIFTDIMPSFLYKITLSALTGGPLTLKASVS